MQRYSRPGQIAPVSLHEISRRPADKDLGDVARIVLDHDFSSGTTEVSGQRAMPVFQGAKHVDAIGPQLTARFRQEGHPKGHAVPRYSQRRFADELPPNRNWRALQTAMDSLMVTLGDLDRKIGFELVQGQTGKLGWILPPALSDAAESRARQSVHVFHHRSHQPFDVTAIVRPAWRSKLNSNALVLAGAPKSRALEIGAVINPDHFGEPYCRPFLGNVVILQPLCFVESRAQHAEPHRQPRGLGHREMKSGDHSRKHVDRQGQPGTPRQRLSLLFVDHHDVDLSVIDLDDLQGSGRDKRARRRRCRFDACGVRAPQRPRSFRDR